MNIGDKTPLIFPTILGEYGEARYFVGADAGLWREEEASLPPLPRPWESMTLAQAIEHLEAKAQRATAFACAADRVGHVGPSAAEKRTDAAAIALVLAALPEGAR